MITLERLKELMRYDPETGDFIRLVRCGKCKAGSRAGTLQASGYRSIVIDYEQYYAHRLAVFYMTGEWPPEEVDHKNITHGDNRWDNLRKATRSQNERNGRLTRANTSGLKGAYFERRRNRWASYIKIAGRGKFLGYFATREAAHEAYYAAAKMIAGEFARAE